MSESKKQNDFLKSGQFYQKVKLWEKRAIDATTFWSVQVNLSENVPVYLLLIANSSLRIFVYSSGESWGGRPPINKFTSTTDLLFSTM